MVIQEVFPPAFTYRDPLRGTLEVRLDRKTNTLWMPFYGYPVCRSRPMRLEEFPNYAENSLLLYPWIGPFSFTDLVWVPTGEPRYLLRYLPEVHTVNFEIVTTEIDHDGWVYYFRADQFEEARSYYYRMTARAGCELVGPDFPPILCHIHEAIRLKPSRPELNPGMLVRE